MSNLIPAKVRIGHFVTQDKDGNVLYINEQEFKNPDPSFRTDEAIESYARSLGWIVTSIVDK